MRNISPLTRAENAPSIIVQGRSLENIRVRLNSERYSHFWAICNRFTYLEEIFASRLLNYFKLLETRLRRHAQRSSRSFREIVSLSLIQLLLAREAISVESIRNSDNNELCVHTHNRKGNHEARLASCSKICM